MLKINDIWLPQYQRINFRAIMNTMSRPGKASFLHDPDTQTYKYLAVLACLLDSEVTLSDPFNLLSPTDWKLLQSTDTTVSSADFILCPGTEIIKSEPKLGCLESPENSATLILCVNSICRGDLSLTLEGPGIKHSTKCNISGLNPQWLEQRQAWVSEFPMGVDMILVDTSGVMAIPRTSLVDISISTVEEIQ